MTIIAEGKNLGRRLWLAAVGGHEILDSDGSVPGPAGKVAAEHRTGRDHRHHELLGRFRFADGVGQDLRGIAGAVVQLHIVQDTVQTVHVPAPGAEKEGWASVGHDLARLAGAELLAVHVAPVHGAVIGRGKVVPDLAVKLLLRLDLAFLVRSQAGPG